MKATEFLKKRNFNNDVEVPTGPVEVSAATEVVKKTRFSTKEEIMAARTAEVETVVENLVTVIWEYLTIQRRIKIEFDVLYTSDKIRLLMRRTSSEGGEMKKFLKKCKNIFRKEDENPSKEELMNQAADIFNSFECDCFEQVRLLDKMSDNLRAKGADYAECADNALYAVLYEKN